MRSVPASRQAPLVQARGLTRIYADGGRRHGVLDGVNLDIHAGELVVVLGRSGSGKSTLLNLVGAMDSPQAGSLSVAGVRLDGLDEDGRALFRRVHVGFVFQAFNLLATLTVRENLLLPLELNGVTGEAALARADALLERLGLGGLAARLPGELSGGEQQRVAVARALIHRPSLVIADEPTGNLDLETGRRVLELLDELTRSEGRTLLMATHSREVVGIADRILTLAEGRIAEVARP
jgi:putative ABC transport system ATP-binding protein